MLRAYLLIALIALIALIDLQDGLIDLIFANEEESITLATELGLAPQEAGNEVLVGGQRRHAAAATAAAAAARQQRQQQR